METSVATPATPAPPVADAVGAAVEASHPTAPAAERATAAAMFAYSAYLHVGPGAQECEHAEDGACQDTTHFHAWCRLPNKFQHRDLYKKATAAKARLLRLLEKEDSDARVVLESELDMFKDGVHLETVIDDLLKAEFAADYVAAITEVNEDDRFENIEQDRERFQTLGVTELNLPDGEQSEEFVELAGHISEWTGAIRAELAKLQEPKRQALRDMDRGQLIDQLRKRRMAQLGDETYLHVYNQWEWFICTMRPDQEPVRGRPCTRYWTTMGDVDDPAPGSMWAESPEVIDAIQATFEQLERDLQAGVSGNS